MDVVCKFFFAFAFPPRILLADVIDSESFDTLIYVKHVCVSLVLCVCGKRRIFGENMSFPYCSVLWVLEGSSPLLEMHCFWRYILNEMFIALMNSFCKFYFLCLGVEVRLHFFW